VLVDDEELALPLGLLVLELALESLLIEPVVLPVPLMLPVPLVLPETVPDALPDMPPPEVLDDELGVDDVSVELDEELEGGVLLGVLVLDDDDDVDGVLGAAVVEDEDDEAGGVLGVVVDDDEEDDGGVTTVVLGGERSHAASANAPATGSTIMSTPKRSDATPASTSHSSPLMCLRSSIATTISRTPRAIDQAATAA